MAIVSDCPLCRTLLTAVLGETLYWRTALNTNTEGVQINDQQANAIAGTADLAGLVDRKPSNYVVRLSREPATSWPRGRSRSRGSLRRWPSGVARRLTPA
jgi:hypothetical protein